MKITELIKSKGYAITAELGPPKGTNLELFYKQASYLKGVVDAANVTDQQSALMKLGSMAACYLLKNQGVEPIMQMTVRDKNRIALQSDLLSASALGIENVLVLTGDPLSIGDHPQAKAVFDIDVMELMRVIRKLESGLDMTDHKLDGAPSFAVAAAMNPCVSDLDVEISKTKKKIESGADFFQTQGIFDVNYFDRFYDRYQKEGFKTPILAGIILIKSVKMANFMNEKIPGIVIPQSIISRFENNPDCKAESVKVAVETMKALKNRVQGFHLMAIGWEELIPSIVKEVYSS